MKPLARAAVSATLLAGCAGGSPGSASPALPYIVDTVATGLNLPWSLAFLPGGDMLVTEKYGGIRRLRHGAAADSLEGVPRAYRSEDSGLLDIAADPEFERNRLVYISFAEGDSGANHTALFRARLEDNRLVDGRVVFRALPAKQGPNHPGSRIAFLPDGTLLLSIGEGYHFRDRAQDLGSALGKIVRLDREGRPAGGNPFLGRAEARRRSTATGTGTPRGCWWTRATGRYGSTNTGPRGATRSTG
jgi:glucose/arabinose dehydrogenase